MQTNLIKFNTYKLERGGLLVPMYDQFNARVGDQGTPLVIQWTQGTTDTPVDLQKNKLHFYATGQVGKYLEKLDDGTGYKMSADASGVEYDDKDSAGTQANGITVAKLPKQFFPQEGIFYGYFGLKDDTGNVYSSINVWFRVLGGVPIMGAAIPYFSTRFDELMETCKGRFSDNLIKWQQEMDDKKSHFDQLTQQALQAIRDNYYQDVRSSQDAQQHARQSLEDLADTATSIKADLVANSVATKQDFDKLSQEIVDKLSKMKLTPTAYASLDDLKNRNPNGNDGLNVTVDDGHVYIYYNGNWKDCGQFQNAALQDTFKTDFNNFRNSVIVAMYQYQLNMSKQLDDFKQQTGETVQSRSGAFHLKGIDLLDQNGNQIIDQIGRKIQVEQLLPITDYHGDQAGLPADSSIVGQTFLSNINRYGTMVIYLDKLDLPNLKKEDGKLKDIPFHIANPKGDLPENGVLDAIKVQGASSAFFDKKNYTIHFKERHTVNGWARNNKFVLKADWNDFSHLRNVGSAKLWANMRKAAISASDVLMINDNDALIDNDNNNIVGEADAQLGIGQGYGAIDGFPCFLVINNTYWGLYNFTIPKDGIMARMSGHGKEAIVSAKDWAPETLFKGPITIKDDGTPDYKGFEVEYVADESNQSWIGTSLNTLINAVDADYDTDQAWIDEVSKYLDFGSAIDHFILTVLTDDQDGTSKNYLLQTWDGKKWYFASYDMDSTFGQHVADGRKLEAPNREGHISFDNYNNKLMWLIAQRCKKQLYDRYHQLRLGVLSEINVNETLENYAMQIPKDAYEYESKRWPSTPGTSVKTLYQLENWYRLSSNFIDEKAEKLTK